MIQTVSEKVLNWMIRNDVVSKEDSTIYLFGIHQGIMSILNIITTLIIASVMGTLLEGVVFILCYMPLRSFAGGYHARTERRCYILSACLTLFVMALCKVVVMNWVLIVVFIIAFLIIWFVAPVEDSNKPMVEIERIVYSKRCKQLIVAELLAMIIVVVFDWYRIAKMICVAAIALGIIVILGAIRNGILQRQVRGSANDSCS